MTDLADLLKQSRQITEHIRVLSEELQTLRIRYHLVIERAQVAGPSSNDPASEGASIHRDTRVRARLRPVRQYAGFWK
jgi:hypothetical protein